MKNKQNLDVHLSFKKKRMELQVAKYVCTFAGMFLLNKTKVLNQLRDCYSSTEDRIMEFRNTSLYRGSLLNSYLHFLDCK